MNWTEEDLQRALHKASESDRPRPQARGQVKVPKAMNRTEAAYCAHLEAEKRIGAVLWFKFEGVTLKLGDDCRFTPDFAVMLESGLIEFHDTKAVRRGKLRPHIEDDAAVKLRVAAAAFPFAFRAVWAEGDGWKSKEF